MQNINPITRTDFPDPDVIRVDDTYYMISTTMHFFPGGALLRSYDLVNWEIASYLFDKLDDTPAERMERELVNYSSGMWAGCLRYHEGRFYCIFGSHTGEGKTYLFWTEDINKPWNRIVYDKYYHDCSLLFDDDGEKYLVYGNRDIHLTRLKDDLSGVDETFDDRIIISDSKDIKLGYEGSHFQKINGNYYVFLIHWAKGSMRTESCFRSKTVLGEYVGKDVLCNDRGYHGMGVAQGGVVDTPDGNWYGVMFQDSGAVGRIPVLTPVTWVDGWPVYGNNGIVEDDFATPVGKKDYQYEDLFTSDAFKYSVNAEGHCELKKQWQWNHQPDEKLWKVFKPGGLEISTSRISINVTHAQNCLTQRMMYPGCQALVTLDASDINEGDVAGLCALQSCFGLIGVTKQFGEYFLIKEVRNEKDIIQTDKSGDCIPGTVLERIRLDSPIIRICLKADFRDMKDMLDFYYEKSGKMIKLGDSHKMFFRLDHFAGNRFGLFIYSTKQTGGRVKFYNFEYLAE